MNEWTVKDVDTGDVWHKDSEEAAEEALEEFGDVKNLEVIPPDDSKAIEDSTDDSSAEVMEDAQENETTETRTAEPVESYSEELPDDGPSVDEDPLVWMPDEFTDEIKGTTAINRKGFEVLAHHYDIECDPEEVVLPTETNFEYAVVKATAVDADGKTYGAFGEADINEEDMVRSELLRYADTRAYKRAISRATGVGMIAVEELQAGEIDG